MSDGKKVVPLHSQHEVSMVPWMSGLVNGLQNRLRRFESARHLQRRERRDNNSVTLSLF